MERYNDEELLYLLHCGSHEAQECLYYKYYKYVKRWIRPFCYGHQGMDMDDYVQVAMMNFPTVLESYRNDLNASLKTFMRLSLVRRFISMLKPSKDRGIYRENIIVSLDDYFGENKGMRYDEVIGDPMERHYPQTVLKVKEKEIRYSVSLQEKASLRELQVIQYKQKGYDEKEISQKLDISLKSVYNAVYRYHKKIQAIDEEDEMC